jgi:serine/threonine-protein kinase
VTVEINVGPKTGKIPDGLVGEDVDKVKKALAGAGFTSIKAQPADNEPLAAKKNEVLSVDPAQGGSAALNQDIIVTYATGKSPVPVLTQRTRVQAEQDAKAGGFKVKFTEKESDQPPGIVFQQHPSAGKVVSRSTLVELTVAKAKVVPPPSSAPPSTPPSTPPTNPSTSPPGPSDSPTR